MRMQISARDSGTSLVLNNINFPGEPMKPIITLLCCGWIFTVSTSAYAEGAQPQSTAIDSAYTITFYTEPSLAKGNTVCFTFTKTGVVTGYAESGTFTTPYSYWTGYWYQDGDELMLEGTDSNLAIPLIGRNLGGGRISGRFLQYPNDASYTNNYEGTFSGIKTTACADSPRTGVTAAGGA